MAICTLGALSLSPENQKASKAEALSGGIATKALAWAASAPGGVGMRPRPTRSQCPAGASSTGLDVRCVWLVASGAHRARAGSGVERLLASTQHKTADKPRATMARNKKWFHCIVAS
jgi:hypothetical protein